MNKGNMLFVILLLGPLVGTAAAEPAGTARFARVFLSEARIERLRAAVSQRQEPVWSAFQELLAAADAERDRTPTVPEHWYVPGFYRDAEGHRRAKNGLRDDANAAYTLALAYRLTEDRGYAEAARRLIDAWASDLHSLSRQDDSTLSFSYHFPALVFAADLLRDTGVWPEQDQAVFAAFLRERALPMHTMDRRNNWGNWGLVLAAACAVYLQDEPLFDQCVERWKFFLEHQLDEQGHLPHEVNRLGGRRGIWYSHFCLMPQTIAAEILRVNGAELYDHVSPSGHRLQQAFQVVARWTAEPEEFPYWPGDPEQMLGVAYFSYFEILNARWPDPHAARLLDQTRPLTAAHSAPWLTLTHGVELRSPYRGGGSGAVSNGG